MELDFSNVWVVVNAVLGLSLGLWTIIFNIRHGNGKKALRIFSGLLVLYFGISYSLHIMNLLDIGDFAPQYLTPFLPLFYFIPLWESRADVPRKVTT